ncbi:hypothetical protein NDU88_005005 [Pleurodeles waltl]|uniref:Uncharacterized protein n=1 Tax=Pleurodeles waltl TaxID=8319 RepID=A0AAV7QG17_PLEWA|nr:hypothetical protein NDU88_005005 [Pleurodeles waltl]
MLQDHAAGSPRCTPDVTGPCHITPGRGTDRRPGPPATARYSSLPGVGPPSRTHRIMLQDRAAGSPREQSGRRQIGGPVHQLLQVTTPGSWDRPGSRGADRQPGLPATTSHRSLPGGCPPSRTRRIMPRDHRMPRSRGGDQRSGPPVR